MESELGDLIHHSGGSFGTWYEETYPLLYDHFESRGYGFIPPSELEYYLQNSGHILNPFATWDRFADYIKENEQLHALWML